MTEAEQLQAIKKWWKQHQNAILTTLSVVLLAISGFKYWNWHQEKISQQASNAYEHLMVSFSNQDNKGVRAYANQLITDYGNTVYADAAHLTLAKLFVSHEKYAKAQKELEYVATHSKIISLQEIAKIRLARLLTAEKSYDKALTELDKVNSHVYLPLVNELKGDIYAATGQYQQAVSFYQLAIGGVQKQGIGNSFLEMKTNDLLAMKQSMSVVNGKLGTA